ncbi:hypothetical protein [Salidesulfovibrio brasiliensis]|uniref:hypothetical protein n=1 Tax=Salidesulfovibrio brasiliensis TaxID=221711 RepID=UPI0006D23590|nr:hypothetical protein [Salidesulfovibrio brasiliensis]
MKKRNDDLLTALRVAYRHRLREGERVDVTDAVMREIRKAQPDENDCFFNDALKVSACAVFAASALMLLTGTLSRDMFPAALAAFDPGSLMYAYVMVI